MVALGETTESSASGADAGEPPASMGQTEGPSASLWTLDDLKSDKVRLPRICKAVGCSGPCPATDRLTKIVQDLKEEKIRVCACCCKGGLKFFCVACKDRSGAEKVFVQLTRGVYADLRNLEEIAKRLPGEPTRSALEIIAELVPMWREVPPFNTSFVEGALERIEEHTGKLDDETKERARGLVRGYVLFGIDVAAHHLSFSPNFPAISIVIKTRHPIRTSYLVRIVYTKKGEEVPIIGICSGLDDERNSAIPAITEDAIERLVHQFFGSGFQKHGPRTVCGIALEQHEISPGTEIVGHGSVEPERRAVWEAQIWSDGKLDPSVRGQVQIALHLGGRTAPSVLLDLLRDHNPTAWEDFQKVLHAIVEAKEMPEKALDPATSPIRIGEVFCRRVLSDVRLALHEKEKTQSVTQGLANLLQALQRHEYLIPVPETAPSQTMRGYLDNPTQDYIKDLERPLIISGLRDYPEDFLEDIDRYGHTEKYLAMDRRFFVDCMMAATKDGRVRPKYAPAKKVWRGIIKRYWNNPSDRQMGKEMEHIVRFLYHYMKPSFGERIILDSLCDCVEVAGIILTLGLAKSNPVRARIKSFQRLYYVTRKVTDWGRIWLIFGCLSPRLRHVPLFQRTKNVRDYSSAMRVSPEEQREAISFAIPSYAFAT